MQVNTIKWIHDTVKGKCKQVVYYVELLKSNKKHLFVEIILVRNNHEMFDTRCQ